MNSILLFLILMTALVVVAIVVNKLTGTKAQDLEALALLPGERILWQEEKIDAFVLAGVQPLFQSFGRLGRDKAVLTNLRLVWGRIPLGGGGHMIQNAVVFSRNVPGASGVDRLDAGFFGGGYSTHLADPASFEFRAEDQSLNIVPAPTAGSTNIRSFKLFVRTGPALQAALAEAVAEAKRA